MVPIDVEGTVKVLWIVNMIVSLCFFPEMHAVVQELKGTVGEIKMMCISKQKPDTLQTSSSQNIGSQIQEPCSAQGSEQVSRSQLYSYCIIFHFLSEFSILVRRYVKIYLFYITQLVVADVVFNSVPGKPKVFGFCSVAL